MLRPGPVARVTVAALFTLVVLVLVVAPVAVLVLASVAASWNSVLPTEFTSAHLSESLSGDNLQSLSVSVQTALVAGLLSVLVGTWAALAARALPERVRGAVDAVFHLPAAVPSVVVGLGVLVAFSGPPLMLAGTPAIVIVAQSALVLSFAFSSVSGAVARLDPAPSRAARSLGASGARVLWRVELPALLPAIATAFGLAMALCMGELGATVMVYPPTWRTLPVSVFARTDRGDLFGAASDALVLIAVTVVVLALVDLVRRRAR